MAARSPEVSKIPLTTESYLRSSISPKFVLVKLHDSQGGFAENFSSLRKALEERIRADEPGMIYDEAFSPVFNLISLTSSSADFIRSLAERHDVKLIMHNAEVRLHRDLQN